MPRAGRRRRGELSLSLRSATSEFYVQLPRGGERSSGQARPPAAPSRVNHSLVRPVQPIARGPLGAFVPGRKGYEMALGLLLVLSTVSQRPLPPPQFRTEALRRVDSIATAEFAKDSLGSITISVVSGPHSIWAQSYGYADSARTRLATPATVYRIASITKQFTAIMLMQLLERHQVHLADPVERYLPEARRVRGSGAGSAGVTLVQLATMTSGLARDPNDGRRSQTGLPEHWMSTLMAALPKTEYTGQPGAGYRYSNIGYAILGAALARAAKVAYLDYQRRYILRPLGMSSTDFQLTPALHQRLATGVDYDELPRHP
jgi:CubicO group peptidase (beta-lactamase class C family)